MKIFETNTSFEGLNIKYKYYEKNILIFIATYAYRL